MRGRALDPDGIYSCAWLATHDPGCIYNRCGTVNDYGQCHACPQTCDTCATFRRPSEYSVAFGRPELASTPHVDDAPVARRLVPLLLLAGGVGVVASFVDIFGSEQHQNLVANLAFVNAVLYVLIALVGSFSFVQLHPGACASTFRRVVPLTPETATLGEIISFPPNGHGGAHLYAVLIRARFLDLFKPSCALLAGAVPLLSFVALTHLEYWRRIWRSQRAERRSQRILGHLLANMRVGRYADAKRSAKRGSDGGGASGGGASSGESGTGSEPSGCDAAANSSGGGGSGRCSCVWQGESIDCPICMEDYVDTDEVVILPCHHMLHKECLLSWARVCARPPRGAGAMATCPLCKAPLAEGAQAEDECCFLRRRNPLRDAGDAQGHGVPEMV